MKKNVCAYVRNANENSDFDKQTELIQNYCEKNDLNLSHIYGEWSSGLTSISERPIATKMFNTCLNGVYDTIIVSNFDRISRNPQFVYEFINSAKEFGINVISVSNGSTFGANEVIKKVKEFLCDEQ